MERETGFEPATNSLEGCDSTTELLPPTASKLELMIGTKKPEPMTAFLLLRLRSAAAALTKGRALH